MNTTDRSTRGKITLTGSNFLIRIQECGFHNVDRRIRDMFEADNTAFEEFQWEAQVFTGHKDVAAAAVDKNPYSYCDSVKRLLAWEARHYKIHEAGMHRVAALGVSVQAEGGSEPYFLTINRKNFGLKTIGFVPLSSLLHLDDVFALRTW